MSMPCGAKKFFAAICFGFLIILCQTLTARALETETDDAALMQQLYSDSGADRLEGALPDYAAGLLDDLGLDGFYPGGVDNVTLGSITAVLRGVISENLREPLRVLCCLVGIVILSAALDAVKSGGAADGALTVVSTLCAVSIIAPPILELTGDLAGQPAGQRGRRVDVLRRNGLCCSRRDAHNVAARFAAFEVRDVALGRCFFV